VNPDAKVKVKEIVTSVRSAPRQLKRQPLVGKMTGV